MVWYGNVLSNMDTEKYRIGKIHISATNPKDAKERITENALNGIGGYVCVSNLRMIRYAGKHNDYAQLMEGSFQAKVLSQFLQRHLQEFLQQNLRFYRHLTWGISLIKQF